MYLLLFFISHWLWGKINRSEALNWNTLLVFFETFTWAIKSILSFTIWNTITLIPGNQIPWCRKDQIHWNSIVQFGVILRPVKRMVLENLGFKRLIYSEIWKKCTYSLRKNCIESCVYESKNLCLLIVFMLSNLPYFSSFFL